MRELDLNETSSVSGAGTDGQIIGFAVGAAAMGATLFFFPVLLPAAAPVAVGVLLCGSFGVSCAALGNDLENELKGK